MGVREKVYGVLEKCVSWVRWPGFTKGKYVLMPIVPDQESPEALADRLSAYRTISFDVFDTLVFRPFSEPAGLFDQVGEQIDRRNFRQIRQKAEQDARKEMYRRKGHYEVTLDEIYVRLEREADIDRERIQLLEAELEEQLCFANPYMLRVVELLRGRGKRLIVMSDMYLPGEVIREILRRCGYPCFDAYYISGEIKKSKSRGDLYGYVLEAEKRILFGDMVQGSDALPYRTSGGAGESGGGAFGLVHIGDNEFADVRNAEKNGIPAVHYKNAD